MQKSRVRLLLAALLVCVLLPATTGSKGSNCQPEPEEPVCTPQAEVCDGVDNDCDGQVDEGLMQVCEGQCGAGHQTCVDGTWSACDVRQPLPEVCNDVDDDCDGQVDEGLSRACATVCGSGQETCVHGSWEGCTAPLPANETCNGQDDDCDGQVDEALTSACSTACGAGARQCTGGAWGACSAPVPTDETCNGQDDDCDGQIDEGVTRSCSTACGGGQQICFNGGWGACSAPLPSDETCNGLDDDCDGLVDEALVQDCSSYCGDGERACVAGAWGPCVCDGPNLPNLVITDVVPVDAAGPCPPTAFDVEISNIGTAVATVDEPQLVGGDFGLAVADTTPGGTSWVSIAPGETLTVRAGLAMAYPLTAATDVTVVVDPDAVVAERDEDDNAWTETLTPTTGGALANLIVDAVTFDPNPAEVTEHVSIAVTLANDGAGAAHICRGMAYWNAGSAETGTVGGVASTNITIAPGDTLEVGAVMLQPGAVPPGDYVVTATADPDGELTESAEGDNQRDATLTVELPDGAPDLVITAVTPAGAAGPCAATELDVEVTNQGATPAIIDVVDLVGGAPAVYVPDTTPDTAEYVTIPVGDSYVVTASVTFALPYTAAMPYTLTADPTDTVIESVEDNNDWAGTYSVTDATAPLPNVQIAGATFSANPAPAAEPLALTVSLHNSGDGDAYLCRGLRLWEAVSATPAATADQLAADTVVLAPGETVALAPYTFPADTLAPGFYIFDINADPDDDVLESNEGDNAGLGLVSVQ